MANRRPPRPAEIDFRVWNQSQSWHYERIVRLGDHKLRIYGRHNAYQNQSYISLQRWDGVQWQHMQTISGAQMSSWFMGYGPGGPEAQYSTKSMHKNMLAAMMRDEGNLIETATKILF